MSAPSGTPRDPQRMDVVSRLDEFIKLSNASGDLRQALVTSARELRISIGDKRADLLNRESPEQALRTRNRRFAVLAVLLLAALVIPLALALFTRNEGILVLAVFVFPFFLIYSVALAAVRSAPYLTMRRAHLDQFRAYAERKSQIEETVAAHATVMAEIDRQLRLELLISDRDVQKLGPQTEVISWCAIHRALAKDLLSLASDPVHAERPSCTRASFVEAMKAILDRDTPVPHAENNLSIEKRNDTLRCTMTSRTRDYHDERWVEVCRIGPVEFTVESGGGGEPV